MGILDVCIVLVRSYRSLLSTRMRLLTKVLELDSIVRADGNTRSAGAGGGQVIETLQHILGTDGRAGERRSGEQQRNNRVEHVGRAFSYYFANIMGRNEWNEDDETTSVSKQCLSSEAYRIVTAS